MSLMCVLFGHKDIGFKSRLLFGWKLKVCKRCRTIYLDDVE